MKAFVLDSVKRQLSPAELPKPEAGNDDVLIRVSACGVCRTDLHIIDGELPNPKKSLVPGHQIVGIVESVGKNVTNIAAGDRVGVPWLGYTCGQCAFCRKGQENLCDHARFTGYQIDGGFAEYTVCHHRFCFKLPEEFSDEQAAPLLCAGLIGYRALSMAGDARILGFYGFGSSAHILIQVARFQGREVMVFTKSGDVQAQEFALKLGASWAGDSGQLPEQLLEAAIIFAPVGSLVPAALRATVKGGVVICAGIHMDDIPSFPYNILWEERGIRSVANLTRKDGEEFLALARRIPVRTIVQSYPFLKVNEALNDLRSGCLKGSAVITVADQRRPVEEWKNK
jgi:propanol-preferring alcohol dehydrogenase